MATLHRFAAQRPLTFVLLVVLLGPSLSLGHWLVPQLWPALAGHPAVYLAGEALLALLAAALLTALGWWRAAGFTGPAHWRALHVLWLPALLALLPLARWLDPTASLPVPSTTTIATVALTALLIGFQEEAFFRGIVLTALLPGGRLRAVGLAALLFGLTHLGGLLLGKHLLFVLGQVISTTGTGVLSGAVRLRTGTLWPLILLHALLDGLAALSSPQATLVIREAPPVEVLLVQGVWAVLAAAAGLVLLRREWRPRQAAVAEPQLVP